MAPLSSQIQHPAQFDIARHYDVMEELDRDVHDDRALADAEVDTVLRLIGRVPRSVFLPCFGTGRHIASLLNRGVRRIVGVDLSPKCVDKARRAHCDDPRVELHVGDLATWKSDERLGAGILLGNSFGDIVDPELLARVTYGMVRPVSHTGVFVMDYIGEGYLDRCRTRSPMRWEAELNGRPVFDDRAPRFDEHSGIMSIDVRVTDRSTSELAWEGTYQKAILNRGQVQEHFRRAGIFMESQGLATEVNPYYEGHTGELGMIARSTWWVGRHV
ncbi:MAG: class I SAM-dependent methyltransferase [Patescibacteria group bacterium]